jgi:hypothetical protein
VSAGTLITSHLTRRARVVCLVVGAAAEPEHHNRIERINQQWLAQPTL